MSRVPSAHLFELIKSLTKAEKRSFKLFAARYSVGGRNKYVRLFDAIDALSEYDEHKLVASHRWLRGVDLTAMKAYVHELILRSLRDTLRERTEVAAVQYQIDKAEILMHKGLYAQASRMLARARETATDHQHQLLLLDILFLESQLKVRSQTDNTLRRHEDLMREKERTLHVLRQNMGYYDLFMRAYYMQLDISGALNDDDRERLRMIAESPLLAGNARPLTRFGRLLYHEAHCRLSRIQSDAEGDYMHARALVEFLDDEREFRDRNMYNYMYAVGTVLYYDVYFGHYAEFERRLDVLKSLRGGRNIPPVDLEVMIYYSQLVCWISTGDAERAWDGIPEIERFIERNANAMEYSSIVQFRIGFLTLAIYSGRVDEAFQFLARLLNDARLNTMPRFLDITKMLAVIVHFERRDDVSLESAIRSLYRAMKARNRLGAFDSILFHFLRKLPAIADRRALRAAFMELRSALVSLAETPEGRDRLLTFDFVAWLTSKIGNVPMTQAIRERNVSAVARPELVDQV